MHDAQDHRKLVRTLLAMALLVVAASPTALLPSARAEGAPRLAIELKDTPSPPKRPKPPKGDSRATLYIREVFVPLRRAPSPDAEIAGWLTLNDGCARRATQNGFWRLRCTFASRPGGPPRRGRRMVEGWGDPALFTEERIELDDVERALQQLKLPRAVDLPERPSADELAGHTQRILGPREERARLLSLRCALRAWDPAACAEALDERAALADFAQRDRTAVGAVPVAGRCTAPEQPSSDAQEAFVACLEKEARVCLGACDTRKDAFDARGYLATARRAFVLFVAEADGDVRILARERQGDVVFELDHTRKEDRALHRLVSSAAGRTGTLHSRWAYDSDVFAQQGEPVRLHSLPAPVPVDERAYVICPGRIARRGAFVGKVATSHWADPRSLLWRYAYETPCPTGPQHFVAPDVGELTLGPIAPSPPVACEPLFSATDRSGEGWGCSTYVSGDMNGDGQADALVVFNDAGRGAVSLWLSGPDGLTRRVSTRWLN